MKSVKREFKTFVVAFMLVVSVFTPASLFAMQQPNCEESAWIRFNAQNAALSAAYNAAELPLVTNYNGQMDVCLGASVVALAIVAAWEAYEMSKCTLLVEFPPLYTACVGALFMRLHRETVVILVAYTACSLSAWIEYSASHDPLYQALQNDYMAAWAVLEYDLWVCSGGS